MSVITFLKVACLYFLLTQLILFPFWISEGFEDFIAIVIVNQIQKASGEKKIN